MLSIASQRTDHTQPANGAGVTVRRFDGYTETWSMASLRVESLAEVFGFVTDDDTAAG